MGTSALSHTKMSTMEDYFIYNDYMSNAKVVSEKLNTYKKRLLDLTARNRMIHSNFQSRTKLHFRFIDELPNQLFKKSKGRHGFSSLPEKKEILRMRIL